jgi:hypothetical protein
MASHPHSICECNLLTRMQFPIAISLLTLWGVLMAPLAFADPIQIHGGGSNGGNSTVEVHIKKANGPISQNKGNELIDSDSSQKGNTTVDPCWYTPVPADHGDSRLGGDNPSEGVLYIISCPSAISLTTGQLLYQDDGYVWARNGVTPLRPPPDPQQVAEEAAGQMTAPDPTIRLGPDPSKLAVKIPTWLWVDSQQPLTLTVAVRGLSVTVTATLKSTTWSMGEPVDEPNTSAQVPSFTCQGTGEPAPASPSVSTIPPCGYTYSWKSLASRTKGTGTWTVTATTNWDVTWTASNGTSGTLLQPLTPSTSQQVAVGEWRSTLVSKFGG